VGANIGLFALASAHRVAPVGRVLAIEPDTWSVEVLRKSLRANKDLPLEILPVAVSDRVSVAAFNIAERGREANYLAAVSGPSVAGGVRETQLVVTVSLDWLAETLGTTPAFLKINVEMAEHFVLRGAETILNRAHPVVLCEVSTENADAVTTILKRHGYMLLDAAAPVSRRVPLEKAVWNTLALPQ
jgi:FkbM family methyltransferase